jgi:hypothetical protein
MKRVLFVDDDPQMLESMRDALRWQRRQYDPALLDAFARLHGL